MEANQRVQSASSGSSTVTSLRVSVMPESAADMTAAIPAVKSVAGNESPLLDAELVPFVVEPDRGVIKAGLSQSFKVKFCPLDVKEFNARLICRWVCASIRSRFVHNEYVILQLFKSAQKRHAYKLSSHFEF